MNDMSLLTTKTAYIHECCNGFKHGLEIERITGLIFEFGIYMFLVKWKYNENLELIESSIMKRYYPQLVIQYYESIISWK